jgi:EAL domain-containing protein (putative c-di-GMP-specific phosphodiesterase class I)
LRNCDAAIYSARERGEGPVAVYASDESAADLALRAELWRALEEGQLLNVYQPQHDLRNAERVGGVETLLRWRHPERGLLSPGEFLGVAEKSELISHVGEWTLRQACRDLKHWKAARVAPEKLAVNVSALDFQRAGFGLDVGRLLQEEGAMPADIELELTESLVLADLPAASATIRALRELGVRVSLDDFGTGYSSLTQLRDLPITGLKVDQSFVAALDRSPEANAILGTLVALASELDLEITAEGVESAWQRDILRRHGCHLAQGYYFARAMPATEMQRYLGGVRTGPVDESAG